MTGKRFHIVWLWGLALTMNSCGTDAPPDAVVSAVELNIAREISGSNGGQLVDGAIHFKVQASIDDTTPVPDVSVGLFGNSPVIGDLSAGFVSGLAVGSAFVNPSNPNEVEMRTNAGGVVTVYYRFTVPPCSATVDIAATALISANIGGSTAAWRDDITVKMC